MSPPFWLGLVATLFLLTSVGITVKQRTAASCPMHQHAAGVAARSLALICLLVGLLLAGMVVYSLLPGRGP